MVPEWKGYFGRPVYKRSEGKEPRPSDKGIQRAGSDMHQVPYRQPNSGKARYHYPPFAALKMEDPVEFVQLSP